MPDRKYTLGLGSTALEKVLWEERCRIDGATLQLVEARVRGHGADMEPPPQARAATGTPGCHCNQTWLPPQSG